MTRSPGASRRTEQVAKEQDAEKLHRLIWAIKRSSGRYRAETREAKWRVKLEGAEADWQER